ncbi:MAG TPA: 1-deoxy-D-xylulose-5-phosphate reductoisomerase [bacterium]|nr:1-deoxy-D-xylulose-5-phosphate reductoisomerase [bacterium]
MRKRTLSILGSTGSIGLKTLTVARSLGFPVVALGALDEVEEVFAQIEEFRPRLAFLFDEPAAEALAKKTAGFGTEVASGTEGLLKLARVDGADTFVAASSGSVALEATYEAVRSGMDVALANKEVLVAAGSLFIEAVKEHDVELLPIDSEHSAIWQCLGDRPRSEVARLIITASGGPFLNRSDLTDVTPSEALRHPNWSMGAKITVDSATLFNKGLELIEAHWLFGIHDVEVLVHPQSVVHSLVEFADGSVLGQLGRPDMLLPIQYALTHPDRVAGPAPRLDLTQTDGLEFFPVDENRFPALGLARRALSAGGLAPAHLSAADEVAVEAFLTERIRFTDIPRVLERVLDELGAPGYTTLGEVRSALDAAKERAAALVNRGL